MPKILKRISCFILLFFAQFIAAREYIYTNKIPIDELFHQAIAAKAFPGGCIVAGTAKQIIVSQCFGFFTYANKSPDLPNSLFDLASLTKVIATTSAIMKLYEEGKINLNDRVIQYLPEFQGSTLSQTRQKANIRIKDLLAHTSGLPAAAKISEWNELYKVPLIVPPRTYEIYSDLNFLLLGKIVERISGQSLAQYTEENIFQPLGMNSTVFNPNKELIARTVPTTFNYVTDEYLTGIVNDPLARELGGVAGNAGLFSDAHDLSIFAQMMLNNGRYHHMQIFKPHTVRLFTSRANLIPNSTRALGWDTVFYPTSLFRFLSFSSKILPHNQSQFSAGLYIDGNAYGHTGYTGTSLWISPQYGIFVLLLTNRVTPYICAAKQTTEMYWRQRLNSAIWENLGFIHRNRVEEIPYPSPRKILSDCP